MKQIRYDFATHDFKAWLARLIRRVEQMPLLTLYFEKGHSRREAAREGVGYEAKPAASPSIKRRS